MSGSSQKGGGARYERRSAGEFEDGQVRQTGLTQKSPSPALKEAGQFGSYNLKRFERSHGSNCTARYRARTKRKEQRAPHVATSRTPDRIRAGRERRIRDTDAGEGRSVLRRDWPLGLDRSSEPNKERRVKPTLEKKRLANAAVRRRCGDTKACSQ